MDDKVPSIRVEVPDEYGDAYDGNDGRQWVERRQRIGGKTLDVLREIKEGISDEKAFEIICGELQHIIVDWNLEGDDGPLPKPFSTPEAFKALYASDYRLMNWVAMLPFLGVGDLLASKN